MARGLHRQKPVLSAVNCRFVGLITEGWAEMSRRRGSLRRRRDRGGLLHKSQQKQHFLGDCRLRGMRRT
jgi:hypothetical protein